MYICQNVWEWIFHGMKKQLFIQICFVQKKICSRSFQDYVNSVLVFIKGKHYSYKTLSVIFLFRRNYPYNPYINRKSLNSLKYCATEALPVLTYILNCCVTRSRWNHHFFTQQMHIDEIHVQNQRLQKEFYTRRPRVSDVINHQLICLYISIYE